jgi:hypothetical protein
MYKNIVKVSRIIFITVFFAGLLFPTGTAVRADDTVTPEPPSETAEVVVQQEVSVTEATPETPLVVTPQVAETEDPLVVEQENTDDIFAAISESGSVITDNAGNELPMASVEVAEVIAGADPYIIRPSLHGDVTYRFLVSCVGYINDATNECIETSYPVQMAVNFAAPGETINIEAANYNETVQISSVVVLNGIGGIATVNAFILMGGENVTGSSNVFAPLVYVNNGATINDGLLLAATGGTVNVAPGSYNGQIKIKKSVHLIGAGKASTNILQSGALTSSGSYDLSSIIDVSGFNVEAEISGFNVSGSGLTASTDRIAAIYVFDAATANIHDNLISVGDTPGVTGVGVQVGRSYSTNIGTHAHADIWNNEIVNFTAYGVSVEHDDYPKSLSHGTTAYIHDNLINGGGVLPVGDQFGIRVFNETDSQFGNNARATIAHNLIINNSYAGILLVNARDINVHHNVITDNLNGVVTQTRVSGGVHDNDIYNNTNNNAILNGLLNSSMFSNNWWGTDPKIDGGPGNLNLVNTLPLRVKAVNPDVGIGTFSDPNAENNSFNWYGEDIDEDGVLNGYDNCPTNSNPTQDPSICNGDTDGDLILNNIDNCPTTPNHNQADSNGNGIGNACEKRTSGEVINGFEIPVTGAQTLSCSTADELQLDLTDGTKLVVAFNSILCGYEAILTQEVEETLPLVELPTGSYLQKALTYQLIKDGEVIPDLPTPVLASIKFSVGDDTQNLSILYWDSTVNNWVDLGGTFTDGNFSVETSKTGTFVLVLK